jgi:hypothetical protein
MATIVIEEFALAQGVDADAFVAADENYQHHCYVARRGLQRRTTARRGDEWAVITLFAGSAGDDDTDAAREWLALVDEATYRVRTYRTLD